MARDVYILQLGGENWADKMQLPEGLHWYYLLPDQILEALPILEEEEIRTFDIFLLEDTKDALALSAIEKKIDPYTIFYNQDSPVIDPEVSFFLKKNCAQKWDFSQPDLLLYKFTKGIFHGQYGDKFKPIDVIVNPNFKGAIQFNGYQNIALDGEFGENFRPLLTWKYNKNIGDLSPNEFWIEYEKKGTLEIRLRFNSIMEGSVADVVKEKLASEEEMKQAILIDNDFPAYISVTLEAKGEGELLVGALHARFSRYDFGKYTMGGKILSDSRRQEINYYFHPGDFKPPLAIYFSGFRRAEGFEGFGMMRSLGCPFLLFQDPRIDGGAFYMGSDELEGKIKNVIQEHLDLLGLTDRDLFLSGISMGTYGSLYYGADFNPRGIILGKPLANLGSIARDAKYSTPGVFPTSFDVLRAHTGGNELEHIEQLNQRFWKKFKSANFKDTTFALAYMQDEDYDRDAFKDLLEVLYHSEAKLISKGVPGRHNDDSNAIITWFMNQYKDMFRREYGRKY